MATLKDIAKAAGVSIMTVSNVINKNYSKVSQETVDNVQKIIKEYNYVPNLSARSLSKNKSKLIAVIITTYNEDQNFLKDPYVSELFGEIESFIRQHGYYTIIRSVQTMEHVSKLLQHWNVDGAIFLSPQTEEAMEQIYDQSKCPVVFIDSVHQTRKEIPTVSIDDFKGGYIATKYLINYGHKRIAFASWDVHNSPIISQRFLGYRKALEEANIEYTDDLYINTLTRYEDGFNIGRNLANHSNDITALFATADLLALGVIEGAMLNGCMVPNDLSVIGFDNLEICSFVRPKLTTVSQDVKKKAKASTELLFSLVKKEACDTFNIVLDVQLEARQTVQNIL